ncbi:MAG: response regulator [Candidatus Hydrothermarchaeaceae archaeon]
MATIMVVDDEPDVVKVATIILEKAGYEVVPAYSCEEALEKLKEVKPDLITLDIMMPEIDGFETLKRLREKKETSSIPVVIISAKVDDSDIVKGLELGATDYFTKPYTKTVLLAKVESILKFKGLENKVIEYSEGLEQKVDTRTQELKEANEKLKVQYYLLEKDLDLAHFQMEHDQIKVTFIAGLTGIFTGVLLLSLIILISTWNIDYLLGLFGVGAILAGVHTWVAQKKMEETTRKIEGIRKKKSGL